MRRARMKTRAAPIGREIMEQECSKRLINVAITIRLGVDKEEHDRRQGIRSGHPGLGECESRVA